MVENSDDAAWRRLSWTMLALGVVVALVQVAFTRSRGIAGSHGYAYVIFGVLVLIVVVVSVSRKRVWVPAAWSMLAAVMALHLLGMVYRAVAQGGLRSADLSAVGVADGVFTIAYLLGLGSMYAMVRHVHRRPERLWRLDAALVFAGFWALGSVAIVDLLVVADASPGVIFVQSFYLTVNALIASFAARLLVATRPHVNTGLRMLITAALIFSIVDALTTSLILSGRQTGVLDGLTAASNIMVMALLAAGALHPSAINPPSRTPHEGRLSAVRSATVAAATVAIAGVTMASVERGLTAWLWVLPGVFVFVMAVLLALRSSALVSAYRQASVREEALRIAGDAVAAARDEAAIDEALTAAMALLLPREAMSWSWAQAVDHSGAVGRLAESGSLGADAPSGAGDSETRYSDDDIVVEQPVGDRYRYRTVCAADSELLIIELHTPLLLDPLDWHAVETLGGRAVDAKARLRLLADSVAAAEAARLTTLMAGSQDTVVLVRADHRIESVMGNVADLTGRAAPQWVGQPVSALIDTEGLDERLDRVDTLRQRFRAQLAGSGGQVEVTITRTDTGDVIVSVHDIAALVNLANALEHRAMHDMLTGLANRSKVHEDLELLTGTWTQGGVTALVLLDVDDFKVVNDSLGHTFGDGVLLGIARRLTQLVGASGIVARIGGDEFAVLLDGWTADDAARFAVNLVAEVGRPMVVNDVEVITRVSAGVACAPAAGESGELLLQAADLALNHARVRGKGNVAVYRKSLREGAVRKLREANAVTTAARAGAFHFDYQPVVAIPAGSPLAMEALMRWDAGADLGRPDAFIPVAESIGELTSMLRSLLPTALEGLARWRRLVPQLSLTVNMHADALLDADLEAWLVGCLEDARVPASSLILEISERALVPEQARRQLESLRSRGVDIWIDDFGTGWSNLSTLERLPVTGVKLAREIVVEADGRLKGDMVAAAVGLASAVGFSVVAEGVERPDTTLELARLGVDAVQGFGIARPMAESLVDPWLLGQLASAAGVQKPLR